MVQAPGLNESCDALAGAAQGIGEAGIARDVAPQPCVGAHRRDRVGCLADGMGHGLVHTLVLVGVGQAALVPALQEGQEQRGQHGHAVDALAGGQALAHGGRDEPGNLGEAVHRHALVGVADGRVAEAVQHHVAVGGQVDGAGLPGAAETRDGVVGHVVVGHLTDGSVVRAFVDEAVGRQRAGPGDAAVRGVQQADLGLFIGLHVFDHLHTHALPLGPAGHEAVFDHPLDEALGGDGGAVIAAGGGLHAGAQARPARAA